ncbi:glycoside hydrolase family 10 protein [Synechococcus sp. CS-205]|uniref:glycoside hydrolase family 10 protein n=1 Tax=Synechococcus sp. CS-205 TaxID=2847984 RepID=UPI00223A8993|nr:glycoside hydrolase family 10 protein [Synechococcus sp. CS-205]MCT0248312.1 glycoside hydrolase family 10 protein [Synechococcus sp. CS-205]
MRRTRWLLPVLLLCGLLLAMVPALPSPSAAQGSRAEVRGVWMTTNDMTTMRDRTKLRAAMEQLNEMHVNTVYPVVWNSGYAIHTSEVTRERKIQSFSYKGLEGQDIIADVISEGHAKGMLVIPWFEFGFMAPPFSELALQHPTWLTQRKDGSRTSISAAGEVVWLNPFRPEVQKFITELVMEVVENYDGDGIQFDDHMSLPNEFGYDSYTKALYARETGRAVPSNPMDQSWIKWRADKISTFMVELHKAVRAKQPKAIVSVSPNYYDFAYKLQLQDWLGWVRRNIVDEVIVQLYRPDVASFAKEVARPEIAESKKKIPTAIGVMTGLRTKPSPMQLIQAQVQTAQQRGLGVAFFYFESLWNSTAEPEDLRRAGFLSLFPSAAPRTPL